LDFELLTQEIRLTLFDITFMTGDVIEVDIANNYERLEFPFDIRRDESIIIPVDEYRTWTAAIEVQTASYRKVSAGLEIETGGFWSGTQTQFGFDVSLRPFPGLELNPEYIRTNVDLAEGDFSTDLFRFEANMDFTNSLFFTTNVQFDNLSKLLGTNNRLRWIITPGSDLYLVYNHNWLENEQFDRFRTLNRSGAVKVSYTHRF
ncbi:MAG: hydrolase, partial [Bacteroidetes bacterium]|nr:hydrolase [Bacteroidota bacterium]